MKIKALRKMVLAVAGAALLVSGCVVRERTYSNGPGTTVTTDEVDVTGPPPPDEVETDIGVSPGLGYVWVGGFWGWGPGGWAWTRGHWDRPPRPGLVWSRPHYEHRGDRHVWVRGGWR